MFEAVVTFYPDSSESHHRVRISNNRLRELNQLASEGYVFLSETTVSGVDGITTITTLHHPRVASGEQGQA